MNSLLYREVLDGLFQSVRLTLDPQAIDELDTDLIWGIFNPLLNA
jgi:hypothetical protein